ncbi:MAG TPA: glycosyltransferase, partial [Polyangia bacterium]|nr:glycosyltransferase [Polyangia bacterium]
MRLTVYTDYTYARHDNGVYAERAFALFLSALSERIDRLVVVGRMRPTGGSSRYRLPDEVDFVGLPYYESLARPLSASIAMARSLRAFWRSLDDVDACWLLGPHPLALLFAALAVLRGRRLVLGVRQDLVAYTRSRHPERTDLRVAAWALDAAFRLLARRCPVIAVGPDIAASYAGSKAVLEILVSLIDEADVVAPSSSRRTENGDEFEVLSVGRLESEKNPLLMADVLARLRGSDPRWRLTVCGEGPLADDLSERLRELGVESAASLRGYVPLDKGLVDLYRNASVLLHVSWTEGFPQVILEAFAAGLPVVATDVGGIRAAAGDAIRLIPAGDPDA